MNWISSCVRFHLRRPQASSASVYLVSEAISEGLEYKGPAFFNVYSGSAADFPNLAAPYLVSASAAQSRALPCFVFDPSAGDDWAARFRLDANPQLESIWPVDEFQYEDQDLQSVSEDLAFTFIDFAASDRRLSGSFISVP